MDVHDLDAVWRELDRQQPRQRRQREDLPLPSPNDKLAGISRVRQLERPCVRDETAGIPPYRVNMAIPDWRAQRFGDPHHHQKVAIGKTRQAWIEYAKNEGLGIEAASKG